MLPIYPKEIMKTELPKGLGKHAIKILRIRDLILECDKKKKIAHIILYGSFARGNWKHDIYTTKDGITHEYASDYDILVTVKAGVKDYINNLENKIDEALDKSGLDDDSHPVSIIYEPLRRVNYCLERKQFFFHDIIKEGILIYDNEKSRIATPRDLSVEERKEISEGYFKVWFKNGDEFLIDCNNAFDRENYKKAAFELHQSVENFFYCTLLTLTGYTPKLHNLFRLKRMVVSKSPKFIDIFPQNNKEQKRLFKLLKDAYIDARYSDDYEITQEELEYLTEQTEKLKEIVKGVCQEKVDSF